MTQCIQTNFTSTFPGRKVLANSSLEILNWMIHAKFLRKEFNECKKLAEAELERSNNYNEFANFILVLFMNATSDFEYKCMVRYAIGLEYYEKRELQKELNINLETLGVKSDGMASLLNGNIYKEEGEIEKAMKYFKKCNLLNPQNVEYLKQIGRCKFLLGKYKQALDIFSQADKLAKNGDWNIYHHLGVCYAKIKAYDSAIEYLKASVSLGRCEKSFKELARIYDTLKDYDNAIGVYQTALRLYPSSTKISVILGLIYMKTEDYRKAFNQLGSSLAHDPTNAEALFTFAAEIQRHGEFDVALIKYKVAVQKLPECAEMWNNIGMCFFGKRKYVSAITCLKRSFYLNPLNWLTCFNLGLLHLNMKQNASAALFLSSAAKLNSQHASTFTLLGLALKQLGDNFNCKKSFEEALKLNPNDIEACINYSQFLYSIGEIEESKQYYSHYQHLQNVTLHIDQELIQMGSWLADALRIPKTAYESMQNDNKNEDNISEKSEPTNSKLHQEQKHSNDEEYLNITSTAVSTSSIKNVTRNEDDNIEEDLV